MTIMNIKHFLIITSSLVVLDLLWTGFLARNLYVERIGALMRAEPVWLPIVVFYLLYSAAILYFAVAPGGSLAATAFRGAFLGLTAYGTYDLVNYALLAHWPLSVTLIDMAWGVLLTATVACIGVLI